MTDIQRAMLGDHEAAARLTGEEKSWKCVNYLPASPDRRPPEGEGDT